MILFLLTLSLLALATILLAHLLTSLAFRYRDRQLAILTSSLRSQLALEAEARTALARLLL